MAKTIRPTYPGQFSVGLLLLIFVVSFFLSHQIFDIAVLDLHKNKYVYVGMFLVSVAVINMVLILWEEILFPVKLMKVRGGLIFRNHRTKLITQVIIYLSIPIIFTFIYFEYDVKLVRFLIWAIVCTGLPVIEKIVSGINNYNDFLKLTIRSIEYKNNEKEGRYSTKDLKRIVIVKDERKVIEKIQLIFKDKEDITIDLDEMELDAFYDAIYRYITVNYTHLLDQTNLKNTEGELTE